MTDRESGHVRADDTGGAPVASSAAAGASVQGTVPGLVSVIVPTYNTPPEQLEATVASALAQTHGELEALVIDDGSEVPFAGLRERMTDRRIRWLPLQANGGVAAARNHGIAEAAGEYVAFLDAGDWWEPEKLQKQVELAEASGAAWVYCGVVGHTPDGRHFEIEPVHRGSIYRDLLKDQIVTGSCSAVLVKKSLVEAVGGFHQDEDLHEDWDLWIRVARIAAVDYVPEPVAHLRVYDDTSRSKQLEALAGRRRQFIARHAEELGRENLLEAAWSRHYLSMGRRYLMQGKPAKAIGNWLKIVRINPVMFPLKWVPLAVLCLAYRPLFRRLVLWRRCRPRRRASRAGA